MCSCTSEMTVTVCITTEKTMSLLSTYPVQCSVVVGIFYKHVRKKQFLHNIVCGQFGIFINYTSTTVGSRIGLSTPWIIRATGDINLAPFIS